MELGSIYDVRYVCDTNWLKQQFIFKGDVLEIFTPWIYHFAERIGKLAVISIFSLAIRRPLFWFEEYRDNNMYPCTGAFATKNS